MKPKRKKPASNLCRCGHPKSDHVTKEYHIHSECCGIATSKEGVIVGVCDCLKFRS